MSAQRSPRRAPATPDPAYQLPDMAPLHARRAQARRLQRLARLDLAIGVGVALFLLIISPGLAITALVALIALLGCAVWVVVERRRARARRVAAGPPRGPREPASRSGRSPGK